MTGSESSGRGAVQVQFNVTRDASGGISSATANFYFQLTGFPAGTTIVGAHIHPAPAGVNGPVIISTGLTAANTVTLTNGTGDFTFSKSPSIRRWRSRSSTTRRRSTSTYTPPTTPVALRADNFSASNNYREMVSS